MIDPARRQYIIDVSLHGKDEADRRLRARAVSSPLAEVSTAGEDDNGAHRRLTPIPEESAPSTPPSHSRGILSLLPITPVAGWSPKTPSGGAALTSQPTAEPTPQEVVPFVDNDDYAPPAAAEEHQPEAEHDTASLRDADNDELTRRLSLPAAAKERNLERIVPTPALVERVENPRLSVAAEDVEDLPPRISLDTAFRAHCLTIAPRPRNIRPNINTESDAENERNAESENESEGRGREGRGLRARRDGATVRRCPAAADETRRWRAVPCSLSL